MSVRVVVGEVGVRDVTTRVTIPTTALPRWPPFERVAETIATPRRPFPLHRHEGVEVLTYVIEGQAAHEFGPAPPATMGAGAVMLINAAKPVSHAINPGKGHTVRWFSAVATLPAGSPPSSPLQLGQVNPVGEGTDGALVRPLVGPGSSLPSAAGLEATIIEYGSDGTSFHRVGHDRVAIFYALRGRGRIDDSVLDGGEGALVEGAAGVALHGQPGFHVVFVSAPRPK
jgi:quercetin 2,3-dioxygenase